MSLRTSPLDAEHRALGAKMVEFGGWEMPISYPAGTLAEHRACRDGAAVFDVSHLGTVRVSGPGAFDALQWALTNDLRRIAPGQAQYTHLLDPADGSVLDDIIVWWVDHGRFDVMPNASNTAGVTGALAQASGAATSGRVEIVDVTATRAVLAVQGPQARALLAAVAPDAAAVGRLRVARFAWDEQQCVAAGTGYTGEDGVELAVPVAVAPSLWRAVVAAGVTPAGLGARDTLRLEAGLPLHGHELGPGITPLQAGLAWVVRFDKGDFRGRDVLLAEQAAGVGRRLRGLVLDGRQPARAGTVVLAADADTPLGEVTSGNFSPVLERGIALAFLAPDVPDGTEVDLDVRGRRLRAHVHALPFVARDR